MTLSLYDVSVLSFVQTLAGVEGFLAKGLAHCKEHKIDPGTLVETRLIGDMHPLRFQVQQTIAHSKGAIEALSTGRFSPHAPGTPEDDYAALQALVAETRAGLQKLAPAEINARAGADIIFSFGDFKIPFTAENFILSFTLPNLYFHAATAYDILRQKGVAIGKRDFTGPLRIKK